MSIIIRDPYAKPLAKWQLIAASFVGLPDEQLARMDYDGAKDALNEMGVTFIRHSYRRPDRLGSVPFIVHLFDWQGEDTMTFTAAQRIWKTNDIYAVISDMQAIYDMFPPPGDMRRAADADFGRYADIVAGFVGLNMTPGAEVAQW